MRSVARHALEGEAVDEVVLAKMELPQSPASVVFHSYAALAKLLAFAKSEGHTRSRQTGAQLSSPRKTWRNLKRTRDEVVGNMLHAVVGK